MIDVYPFAGFTVAVLGLSHGGRKAAVALDLSDVDVWAWDDDAENRAAAEDEGVPLIDLNDIDWREPVSLVVEHQIPHGKTGAHPLVEKAREAGAEVISDLELLARAQRDAEYIAIISRNQMSAALDLLEHTFSIAGRDVEAGGDEEQPLLDCHPLEGGGAYIVAMPPGRADTTVSVTFDQVLLLDIGGGDWAGYGSRDEAVRALRWVFHRQTAPKGAVINIDDPVGRELFNELAEKSEQVLIPLSLSEAVVGGVYQESGWLIDDRKGDATRVVQLPTAGDPAATRLALSAYTLAVLAGVPEHAAMASMMGYYND